MGLLTYVWVLLGTNVGKCTIECVFGDGNSTICQGFLSECDRHLEKMLPDSRYSKNGWKFT